MSRPSLSAKPAANGRVFASIGQEDSAVSYLLTAQEAEAWALKLMAAVDESRGRPLFREEAVACGHAVTGSCSRCATRKGA